MIGDRAVHYLRAGSGPAAVLIHSSPSSSDALRPLIARLAPRFTCFAFDTPGFGSSQALPGEELTVADLADALAATMDGVGLSNCPVFGTHTGAAIALELAVRRPDLVSGLVADAVPAFMPDERAQFEGYFAPMQIDALGGHFTRVWTRFRDQSIWFPWTSKRPENLNPYDLNSPAIVHDWVMTFFRCGKTYAPAYKAAIWYGLRAIEAIGELRRPAVFTALTTDMLHPHMARFPVLRADQEIRQIGASKDERDLLIEQALGAYVVDEAAPADLALSAEIGGIRRAFVDCGARQVHVRTAGDPSLPALMLLHDAPGSAAMLEPMIKALAQHFHVCAPDLPGCGESPGFDPDPDIDDFARCIKTICDSLHLTDVAIYGVGVGASVAIQTARLFPQAFRQIVLRGVLLPSADQRADLSANFAPSLQIDEYGAHWYRTWMMLRDSQVYWPWYDRTRTGQRRLPADFSGQHLHDWTFEVMKQGDAYRQVIVAALAHDAGAALADISLPLVLCRGPGAPFSAFDPLLNDYAPDARMLDFDSDPATHADDLVAALDVLRANTSDKAGKASRSQTPGAGANR